MDQPTEPHPPATIERTDLVTVADDPGAHPQAWGEDPMNRERPQPIVGARRHGNPRGNPNAAPRCGARNRAGTPCRAPAMRNGRCRSHGGKSTGPRTQARMQRLREARTVHGYYGEDGRAFRRTIAALFAQGR
jgi:hypothetical protein